MVVVAVVAVRAWGLGSVAVTLWRSHASAVAAALVDVGPSVFVCVDFVACTYAACTLCTHVCCVCS